MCNTIRLHASPFKLNSVYITILPIVKAHTKLLVHHIAFFYTRCPCFRSNGPNRILRYDRDDAMFVEARLEPTTKTLLEDKKGQKLVSVDFGILYKSARNINAYFQRTITK